LYDLIFF